MEVSDWYGRRLTIHRSLSYATIPIFAAQWVAGERIYKYGNQAPEADVRPSCWICTLDVMRGLGQAGSVPVDLVDRVLGFWQANIEVEADHFKSRLPHGESVEERAGLDHSGVAVLVAILEFCARVGLQARDDRVRRFLALLDRLSTVHRCNKN